MNVALPHKEYFLVERIYCLTCGGFGSVAGVTFTEPRDPNPRVKCLGCNGEGCSEFYTPITSEEATIAWDAIESAEFKKQQEGCDAV